MLRIVFRGLDPAWVEDLQSCPVRSTSMLSVVGRNARQDALRLFLNILTPLSTLPTQRSTQP